MLGEFNDKLWVDVCVRSQPHFQQAPKFLLERFRSPYRLPAHPPPVSIPPSLVFLSLPNYSSWLPNKWQHAYVRSIGLKVMHISHQLPASVWSHPTPAGSSSAGIH